jgi:hypothetical protein
MALLSHEARRGAARAAEAGGAPGGAVVDEQLGAVAVGADVGVGDLAGVEVDVAVIVDVAAGDGEGVAVEAPGALVDRGVPGAAAAASEVRDRGDGGRAAAGHGGAVAAIGLVVGEVAVGVAAHAAGLGLVDEVVSIAGHQEIELATVGGADHVEAAVVVDVAGGDSVERAVVGDREQRGVGRLQGHADGVGDVGEAPVARAAKHLRLLPDGEPEDAGVIAHQEVDAAVEVLVVEDGADGLRRLLGGGRRVALGAEREDAVAVVEQHGAAVAQVGVLRRGGGGGGDGSGVRVEVAVVVDVGEGDRGDEAAAGGGAVAQREEVRGARGLDEAAPRARLARAVHEHAHQPSRDREGEVGAGVDDVVPGDEVGVAVVVEVGGRQALGRELGEPVVGSGVAKGGGRAVPRGAGATGHRGRRLGGHVGGSADVGGHVGGSADVGDRGVGGDRRGRR